jgi:membrane fusion protein (multidrug efflux system)
MRISSILAAVTGMVSLSLPACHNSHAEEKNHGTGEAGHEAHHKIVLTNPLAKDVTITQPYVCQIRSKNHTEICARAFGILEEIPVKEGQSVKKGEILFKVAPPLYQAKYESELAEYQVALQEYKNTEALANTSVDGKTGVVSQRELAIFKAKLGKAEANVNKAQAELNFATVRAPFDGIIDRQQKQLGSTVKEGELLTTLSDNSTMWVRFNVPEARYYEFMSGLGEDKSLNSLRDWMNKYTKIELMLADGSKFPQRGVLGTIEADFNNTTGNINFRADFSNPSQLLRNGQTGTVLIHRTLHDAIVIPQRATYEILDKRYVYVVGDDHIVHQRPITILHEMDDVFVIKSGLRESDKIVLEGVRQVREGEKLHDCEICPAEEALSNLKNHAE